MLLRKFANTNWVVGSPSVYICQNHPKIQATFTGKCWLISKVKKAFSSMIAVSLHVEKAQRTRPGSKKPKGMIGS